MQELTNPSKEFPIYLKIFIIIAKLLGYLLAVVFLSTILGGGMSLMTPNLNPEDLQLGSLKDWRSMSLIYFGMTIAAVLATWGFRTAIDRLPIRTAGLKWENVFLKTLKGAGWAIGLLSISFLILYITGAVSVTIGDFQIIDLLGFLLFFLLISIFEEVIFRGYITSLLAQDFHFFPTLILSSLIFAAVHIGNADFTWIGFVSIFLGGYLLGIFFLKDQDLYLPIGMHWLWNYYHGNVLGFDVSGIDVPAFLDLTMNGSDWITGGEFGLEGSIITTLLLLIAAIFLSFKWSEALTQKQEFETVA